jgi:hypothetical protein
MYLIESLPDHLNDKSAELVGDIRIEYAAPGLPCWSTDTKNATRN